MSHFIRYNFILFCLLLFVASSCTDKWDEHNEITDLNLKDNLVSKIKNESQLSIFSELLVKSGYDSVLLSSKNFTVWAPTNEALSSLDATVINNPALLRSFVGNHIAYNTYFTNMPNPLLQLKALNGKNIVFTANAVDEFSIIKPNLPAYNGVLHIINGAISPKQNIYEFLISNSLASKQRDFILSLNYKVFDPTNGEIIGLDPKTGKPVYKAGTDSAVVNSYLNVANINNEDKLYTYVILEDAAFEKEVTDLSGYFTTTAGGPVDTTALLTKKSIIKDLAFDGLYLPENLPDSLKSIDSVNVHLDKSAIVSSHRVSNGIVYVMKRVNYNVSAKLKPVIIQGESLSALSIPTLAFGFYTRRDTDGISTYRQVRGLNFAAAKSWYKYTATLNSVTYKVYWRAIRDFDLAPGPSGTPTYFPQRIAFKTFDAADLPYMDVAAKEVLPAPATGPRVFVPNYDETYIGEYTVSKYGKENVFIVSNTVNTVGLNSIVLDYIKLVPVIK